MTQPDVTAQIIREIYIALERLGSKPGRQFSGGSVAGNARTPGD
jgi:hypothetical protein